jgi:arylsulfatase A-like enzyme
MAQQIVLTLAAIVFTFAGSVARAVSKPPNVVIFLTDDQGWGDLSINGNTNLRTPHIDSLSRDGASVNHFYVCQVCAPTRAEFLTGRYYPKTGVSGVSRGQGRLNYDETTIADVFKTAGYSTGAFGKWHNGTQPPYHPNNRGFNEFYGFTSGHWGHYFSPPLDHNGERVRGSGYVVDDFTDHALSFIESNQNRPFFCYIPYNTPHSPMMVDDAFYHRFENLSPTMRHRDPKREDIMMTRAALAMCENIDWNVGRVLKKLDELNLQNNTIVVFFSDNGPNSFRWNGGMKGRKGSIDEGGLRSPLFIRWPAKIQPGLRIPHISGAIDLLPTLSSLADIEHQTKKPIDGISFSPHLLAKPSSHPPRTLFSIKNNEVSVRTQKHRLDAQGKLYDIAEDPGQLHDIAEDHPELVAALETSAKQHALEMKKHFDINANRPFTVGFGPTTTLPARDGIEHGTIKRSSKAPNNSFFTHWTNVGDNITWDIEVGEAGRFQAIVHYTCKDGDEGSVIELSHSSGESASSTIVQSFDPPLYDKSKERVSNSHYFVKDFKPHRIGILSLPSGQGQLKLGSRTKPGKQVIDLHSIDLIRVP